MEGTFDQFVLVEQEEWMTVTNYILSMVNVVGWFFGAKRYFQQYFNYIVTVSFTGGGNHRPAASHWQTSADRVFIAKRSTQEVHRSTDYGPEVHRSTDYGPSHTHFVVSRGLYDEELY